MKTLLIIDANLGQARAYMAKTLLGAAAHKANLEIIDNPNDAEWRSCWANLCRTTML